VGEQKRALKCGGDVNIYLYERECLSVYIYKWVWWAEHSWLRYVYITIYIMNVNGFYLDIQWLGRIYIHRWGGCLSIHIYIIVFKWVTHFCCWRYIYIYKGTWMEAWKPESWLGCLGWFSSYNYIYIQVYKRTERVSVLAKMWVYIYIFVQGWGRDWNQLLRASPIHIYKYFT